MEERSAGGLEAGPTSINPLTPPPHPPGPHLSERRHRDNHFLSRLTSPPAYRGRRHMEMKDIYMQRAELSIREPPSLLLAAPLQPTGGA